MACGSSSIQIWQFTQIFPKVDGHWVNFWHDEELTHLSYHQSYAVYHQSLIACALYGILQDARYNL